MNLSLVFLLGKGKPGCGFVRSIKGQDTGAFTGAREVLHRKRWVMKTRICLSRFPLWRAERKVQPPFKRVLGNSKCRPLILLGETCVSENHGKWRCLFPQFAEAQKSTVRCWFRRFSPYRFHAGSQGRRRECDFSRGSHDTIGTYGQFPNTLFKRIPSLGRAKRQRFPVILSPISLST